MRELLWHEMKVCVFSCLLVLAAGTVPTRADVQPPMMAARAGHFAFPAGGSQVLLLSSGAGMAIPAADPTHMFELYDYKTRSSKALASPPFAPSAAIQLSSGSILACSQAPNVQQTQCAFYSSTATDQWTLVLVPSTIGIDPIVAPLPGNSALIAGGSNRCSVVAGCTILYSSYVLDSSALTWRQVGDLGTGYIAVSTVVLSDGRLMMVGSAGTPSQIFDPAKGVWTPAATAPQRASGLLAVKGNKVVTLSPFQVFDAATGQWTAFPNAPVAAGPFYQPLQLPNGRVLTAGGLVQHGDTNVAGDSTMVFDAATGSAQAGAELQVPRLSDARVVLPDGEVLLTGGVDQYAVFRPGGSTPPTITASVESFPWEPFFTGTLDPGFYIATATQSATGEGGFAGIEVHSSGPLSGGLNFGGFLPPEDIELVFGAFYIATPQTVTATAALQFAQTGGAFPGNLQFGASIRILDVNKKVVAGPVSGLANLNLTASLTPGFYSAEIHSQKGNSTPAAVQIALTADSLQAGGSGGAMLHHAAGIPLFVAFYLASRQDVVINLYNRNTYGVDRGAGEVVLTLKDGTGKTIFQSGPGALVAPQ